MGESQQPTRRRPDEVAETPYPFDCRATLWIGMIAGAGEEPSCFREGRPRLCRRYPFRCPALGPFGLGRPRPTTFRFAAIIAGGHWKVKGNCGGRGGQQGRLLVGFAEPGVGPVDEDSDPGTERTVCMAA